MGLDLSDRQTAEGQASSAFFIGSSQTTTQDIHFSFKY